MYSVTLGACATLVHKTIVRNPIVGTKTAQAATNTLFLVGIQDDARVIPSIFIILILEGGLPGPRADHCINNCVQCTNI